MTEQLQFGTVLDELIEKTLRSLVATDIEKAVLGVLRLHRGSANAIKSSAIVEQLSFRGAAPALRLGHTKENSRRAIAGAIENLVELHRLPIGGLRVPPYGYFLIETPADLDLAIKARWGEIYAHLRYLRALTSKTDVARLFDQQMLELDAEGAAHVPGKGSVGTNDDSGRAA